MNNVHVTLTEFRNESRILKEVDSLNKFNFFDSFTIIALGAVDLPKYELINSNIKVVRMNLWSRGLPKSSFFQFIKFLEFLLRTFVLVCREKSSVVNVHSLALLPLGWALSFTLKSKLVYDAHELETETNGLQGISKIVSKFVERTFIRSCDMIIVVSDKIANWYKDTYSIKNIFVVKNAPRLHALNKNDLFRELLPIRNDQKILLYQGALMEGRGVESILKSFENRQDDSLVVVFMGYGLLQSIIEESTKNHNNIFFYPAVDPKNVLEYTSSADIGISMIENTCLSYLYCMPNKLFEYAMAGLPVLVSNMEEMAEAVLTNNIGVVASDFSIISINTAIDSLLNEDADALSENSYKYACRNAWEEQEKIIVIAYQGMLDK